MAAASEVNKRRKPILIGVGVAAAAGGGWYLWRAAEKRRYLELAAQGDVNVIAAQRAYELLPLAVKQSTWIARLFLQKSFFRGANEIQEFFRSESFKSSYFKIVTTVTDEGRFKSAFRALYGFSLYGVLDLFLTPSEVASIRSEAAREKVRATTNAENRGRYIVTASELTTDDIMYFLVQPAGWSAGYAWIGGRIGKGVFLGLHDGTELYKVKDGKQTRKGYRFTHLQSYVSGGKTFTAKATFLVDSSKVKLVATDPVKDKQAIRFDFWKYYNQTKYVADYISKAAAALALYKKRKALGGWVPPFEVAMSKLK